MTFLIRFSVVLAVTLSASLLSAAPLPEIENRPESAPHEDLAGSWKLTLPSGFIYTIELQTVERNRYRFVKSPGNAAFVLGGVYEKTGRDLRMVDPIDDRMTPLVWRRNRDGLWVLIHEPDSKPTGSSYLGCVLEVISEPATKITIDTQETSILRIEIDSEKVIRVGSQVVKRKAVRDAIAKAKPIKVVIAADKSVPVRLLMQLVDTVQAAGVPQIQMLTKE